MAVLTTLVLSFLSQLRNLVPSWGLALILFTAALKLILLPLQVFNFRQQTRLRKLSPQIEELRRLHRDDTRSLHTKMVELKTRAGVRDGWMLFTTLVQWPVLIAVYRAVSRVGVNEAFLWLPSLAAHDPYFILPLTLSLLSYLTFNKLAESGGTLKSFAAARFLLPAVQLAVFAMLPSGVLIYYLTSQLLQSGLQHLLSRT